MTRSASIIEALLRISEALSAAVALLSPHLIVPEAVGTLPPVEAYRLHTFVLYTRVSGCRGSYQ